MLHDHQMMHDHSSMGAELEAALSGSMALGITSLGAFCGALIMWIAFKIRDHLTPSGAGDEKEALLPKSAAEDDCAS
jgi:hypothetical protein